MKKNAFSVLILFMLTAGWVWTSQPPLVGESEHVYNLAAENTEVRGLAFDEVSADAPRLFVLDAAGKIFIYKPRLDAKSGIDELELLGVAGLPMKEDGRPIESPRGLAFAQEGGKDVVYFLNWANSGRLKVSELWRYRLADRTYSSINLSLYPFKIGEREVLDIAYDSGKILVSFDASGYKDQNLRVRRGIIRLEWNQAYAGRLDFIKHLPDSGQSPSYGLAFMTMDGTRYLWGTVGRDFLYCAEAETGRGLFHFAFPRSAAENEKSSGLAFGLETLWVPEGVSGPDRVHRVNVTKNLDAAYEGPHIVRHLIMTVSTEPEGTPPDPGKVYHYYSRPYAYNQLGNQGIWPETEKFADVSQASNAQLKTMTLDPGSDPSSRQYLALVEYGNAPARKYSSRYEIDIWTNPYRKFVYPHRVNKNIAALKGTNYLADDPVLYNLSDKKTYDEFFARVRAHIEEKYGAPADLTNPYWAARNVLEYIQDSYYYPSRPKRKPAAVDYERKHYDANPGNLKIELSDRPYDKNQIIACSGTSVMVAGALRYLGIPARWLGTGTEQNPGEWDANGNGLLDEDETAPCSNGHRYSQVWLGDNYGWICFDATPTLPDDLDFDPPPPLQPQWRYMNRAAAGHLKDKRIVFNVGSGLILPLYRDFEYDERLAVNNDCGGDQRYNLQGRFDKPEVWKLARHEIAVTNVCFIREIALSGPKQKTEISWLPVGRWDRDPNAKVSVYLRQMDPEGKKSKDAATLLKAVPYNAKGVTVDLSGYRGKNFTIQIRKEGDPETGGESKLFEIQ